MSFFFETLTNAAQSCAPHPVAVSALPESIIQDGHTTEGSTSSSAYPNVPLDIDSVFCNFQSHHPPSATYQHSWLSFGSQDQDASIQSITSTLDAPLSFNDDLFWASGDQTGFMNAAAVNVAFNSASSTINLTQGLDVSTLNQHRPLGPGFDVGGSMLDPLQGFNNFMPIFDQPAQIMPSPFSLTPIMLQQQTPMGAIPCMQYGCTVTFKRVTDLVRHEAAVHGINKGVHLCHVAGCNKSQGVGYTRKDKLTEHLWKKHANLGFVKRT